MKVLCISGKAGSGKDTFATLFSDIAQEQGKTTLIIHQADLLKFMCRLLFQWDGNKDEHGRNLLQHIGTDVIRAQNPDYWVNFVIDCMTYFNGAWDYVLIPDCRFPNEINKIREAGFDAYHARITRPNFQSSLTNKQQSHESETALDGHTIPVDFAVTNRGTVPQLTEVVREIFDFLNSTTQ